MADTPKNTQETGRGFSAQPAAAQTAAQPGGVLKEQIPERQTSTQSSAQSAQPRSIDKLREYELKQREGSPGITDEVTEINEMVDQAKQTVNDAYQRASRSVNETVEQAKVYSRENPGTTTLIAFGAGIGVGLLLAGGVLTSHRSRSQRLVQPVMTALTEIAGELFRR